MNNQDQARANTQNLVAAKLARLAFKPEVLEAAQGLSDAVFPPSLLKKNSKSSEFNAVELANPKSLTHVQRLEESRSAGKGRPNANGG